MQSKEERILLVLFFRELFLNHDDDWIYDVGYYRVSSIGRRRSRSKFFVVTLTACELYYTKQNVYGCAQCMFLVCSLL